MEMLIKNYSNILRLHIFLLAGGLIAAVYLIVVLNPALNSLAILLLLAAATTVGLFTNVWGGLLASALAGFAIVLIDLYLGVYPKENYFINIATELAIFLAIGPLAGQIHTLLGQIQKSSNHWIHEAEKQHVHEEHFGTLKPEWAQERLNEEVLRAGRFHRPLSVLILAIASRQSQDAKPAERQAALEALIRLARSLTQAPVVMSYLGEDQLLLILPEYERAQAEELAQKFNAQAKGTMFFPPSGKESLGKPLSEWGTVQVGLTSLDGKVSSAHSLIKQAREALR